MRVYFPIPARRIVAIAAGTAILAAALAFAAFAPGDRRVATPPAPWYPATTAAGDTLQAVFQSRVPCLDAEGRGAPWCQTVKVALVLYHDPRTHHPASYLLARVYVGDGSGRIVSAGSWSVATGTGDDPNARVYELDRNAPEDFRSYWAISDDVIFVLDGNRNPRVGDAGYGYALNRTN
jgi:hypothetical protein